MKIKDIELVKELSDRRNTIIKSIKYLETLPNNIKANNTIGIAFHTTFYPVISTTLLLDCLKTELEDLEGSLISLGVKLC